MPAFQRIELVAEPSFPYASLLSVEATGFVFIPGLDDAVPAELSVCEREGVGAAVVEVDAIGPVIGADRVSWPKPDLVHLFDVLRSGCAYCEIDVIDLRSGVLDLSLTSSNSRILCMIAIAI